MGPKCIDYFRSLFFARSLQGLDSDMQRQDWIFAMSPTTVSPSIVTSLLDRRQNSVNTFAFKSLLHLALPLPTPKEPTVTQPMPSSSFSTKNMARTGRFGNFAPKAQDIPTQKFMGGYGITHGRIITLPRLR